MEAGTFRRVALTAWIMQALIVISGAAVRLTEAGLGCEDWPTCNEDRVLPEFQLHGLIEFGNRVISAFVALSALAVVIAARRRIPRRADLLALAWAVLTGTLIQVVLGGITVLLDLHPIIVGVHFLVSMGLLLAAQVLWFRAGPEIRATEDGVAATGARGREPLLVRAQLALATGVLLTGTVVTGSGPNSGDSRADRLDFPLETVARVHSVTVWCLLVVLVALAIVTAGRGAVPAPLRWLLMAVVGQGAIGYTQFALGVPPLLVELHVVGAVAVWSLALWLYLAVFDRTRRTEPTAVDGVDGLSTAVS